MNTDGFYSRDLTPKEYLAPALIREAMDMIKGLNKRHFDDRGNRTDSEAEYDAAVTLFKESYIGICMKHIAYKGTLRFIGQARSHATDLLNSPLYLSRWTDPADYEKRKIALKREIHEFNEAMKAVPKEKNEVGKFVWKKVYLEPIKGKHKHMSLVAKVWDDAVLRVTKEDGKWNSYIGVDPEILLWREENRVQFQGQYRWLCGGYATPEEAQQFASKVFVDSFKFWVIEGDMADEYDPIEEMGDDR